MSRTLEGQVAIVTGAGGGIGSAYGERVAERGATVVVADLNLAAAEGVAKTLAGRGPRRLGPLRSTSLFPRALRLVRRVLDRNGRLDILVNNAAIYRGIQMAPAETVPIDTWRKIIDMETLESAPGMREMIIGSASIKRLAEPSDLIGILEFLVARSSYMTGQALVIDGGICMVG